MSLTAVKLLSLLIYPLSFSLLLGVIALLSALARWRRSALTLGCVAFVWLYLCSTGLVAGFLMETLERHYPSRAMSVVPEADAIVLVGGGTRGYTHMGTLADMSEQGDRLLHAAALYKAGKAPVILVAGGAPQGGAPESEQMAGILEVMGVPPRDMLQESRSKTTYENAVYVAEALRERGLDQVLLVTSGFHMRRAVAVFEAQGVNVIPAPTDFKRVVAEGVVPGWLPGSGNLTLTSYALHEYIGYLAYRLQGYL